MSPADEAGGMFPASHNRDHEQKGAPPLLLKKKHALTALERAVDALRSEEYEKAQKLLAVSQQLFDTQAANTISVCIDVARISEAHSAQQEAVLAAEEALKFEDEQRLEEPGEASTAAVFDVTMGPLAAPFKPEPEEDERSEEEDANEILNDHDEHKQDPLRPRSSDGLGSTSTSEIPTSRTRAEARRQQRLAEERAALRRKEAARRDEELNAASRRRAAQEAVARKKAEEEAAAAAQERQLAEERRKEALAAERKRQEEADAARRKAEENRLRRKTEKDAAAKKKAEQKAKSEATTADDQAARRNSTDSPQSSVKSQLPEETPAGPPLSEDELRKAGEMRANREAAAQFFSLAQAAAGEGNLEKATRMMRKAASLAPGFYDKELKRLEEQFAKPQDTSPSRHTNTSSEASSSRGRSGDESPDPGHASSGRGRSESPLGAQNSDFDDDEEVEDGMEEERDMEEVDSLELLRRLCGTAFELLGVARVLGIKAGLMAWSWGMELSSVVQQRFALVHAFTILMLVWAWAVGWVGALCSLTWEVLVAIVVLVWSILQWFWFTVFWDPSMFVFPIVFVCMPTSVYPGLQGLWVYPCTWWLVGGGWFAVAAAASTYNERRLGRNGFYTLLLSGCYFGLHWAWHSWWGVLFCLLSIVVYLFLIVLNVAQQENAKGQAAGGLKPMKVPSGAPAEVARVLSASDYYGVLDVPRDAGADEIKRNAKRKKLQTHPDKTGGAPGSNEAVQRVTEASDMLQDAAMRAQYDRLLAAAERGETTGAPVESAGPETGEAGGNAQGGGGGNTKSGSQHERSRGQPRKKGRRTPKPR